MAGWNISFGKTAQIVVTCALVAIAVSAIFVLKDSDGPALPVAVDPFDRPDLTPAQQKFFREVDSGDVPAVRRLVDGDRSLARLSIDPVGTPLHIAATRDMVEMARVLLDAGADINAPGQWGGTPLHWAGYLGRIDTLRLLIERGAAVEQRCTMYESTPLFWTAYGSASAERWQYNRFRGRGFRQRFDANGNEIDWETERARRRAQRDLEYVDCAQALLDAGANINTKNRDGVPAVAFGIPEIIQFMLDHGAINDYVPPPRPPEPEDEPTTLPAEHQTAGVQ